MIRQQSWNVMESTTTYAVIDVYWQLFLWLFKAAIEGLEQWIVAALERIGAKSAVRLHKSWFVLLVCCFALYVVIVLALHSGVALV